MKVREFLNCSEKWTQDAFARNEFGFEVEPDDLFAVKWNLSGAIDLCYFRTVPSETKTYEYKKNLAAKMHQIIDIIGRPDVWNWEMEEGRTFEELQTILKQVDI